MPVLKRTQKERVSWRSELPQTQWHQVMWCVETIIMMAAFTSIDWKDSELHSAASVSTVDTEVKVSSFGRLFGIVGEDTHRCSNIQDQNFVFQHDNTPPHQQPLVLKCLPQYKARSLYSSMTSAIYRPSPIENAWDILGRRVRNAIPLPPPPCTSCTSQSQLEHHNVQWNCIKQLNEFNSLCDSIANEVHKRFLLVLPLGIRILIKFYIHFNFLLILFFWIEITIFESLKQLITA